VGLKLGNEGCAAKKTGYKLPRDNAAKIFAQNN